MYSKKNLEEMFAIADTTVYRTIQACNLSTAQRFYNDEEVERFALARKLFEAGYKFKDVKAAFSLKKINFAEED